MKSEKLKMKNGFCEPPGLANLQTPLFLSQEDRAGLRKHTKRNQLPPTKDPETPTPEVGAGQFRMTKNHITM